MSNADPTKGLRDEKANESPARPEDTGTAQHPNRKGNYPRGVASFSPPSGAFVVAPVASGFTFGGTQITSAAAVLPSFADGSGSSGGGGGGESRVPRGFNFGGGGTTPSPTKAVFSNGAATVSADSPYHQEPKRRPDPIDPFNLAAMTHTVEPPTPYHAHSCATIMSIGFHAGADQKNDIDVGEGGGGVSRGSGSGGGGRGALVVCTATGRGTVSRVVHLPPGARSEFATRHSLRANQPGTTIGSWSLNKDPQDDVQVATGHLPTGALSGGHSLAVGMCGGGIVVSRSVYSQAGVDIIYCHPSTSTMALLAHIPSASTNGRQHTRIYPVQTDEKRRQSTPTMTPVIDWFFASVPPNSSRAAPTMMLYGVDIDSGKPLMTLSVVCDQNTILTFKRNYELSFPRTGVASMLRIFVPYGAVGYLHNADGSTDILLQACDPGHLYALRMPPEDTLLSAAREATPVNMTPRLLCAVWQAFDHLVQCGRGSSLVAARRGEIVCIIDLAALPPIRPSGGDSSTAPAAALGSTSSSSSSPTASPRANEPTLPWHVAQWQLPARDEKKVRALGVFSVSLYDMCWGDGVLYVAFGGTEPQDNQQVAGAFQYLARLWVTRVGWQRAVTQRLAPPEMMDAARALALLRWQAHNTNVESERAGEGQLALRSVCWAQLPLEVFEYVLEELWRLYPQVSLVES